MNLNIKKDTDTLNKTLARHIIDHIRETLNRQDRFTWALSGGETPAPLYRLMATEPLKNEVDWSRVHFFWGDERVVPFTDKANNAAMAYDSLLSHIPVKEENIKRIRTDTEPEAAASAYEKILHEYFPDPQYSFDLVLLGLGKDAHTLSLFPGYPQVLEKKRWVTGVYLTDQHMHRITLTPPAVNAAGRVIFLVSGAEKAASVFHVLSEEHNPSLYPAQVIQPYNSELSWWVDQAAAADL